MVVIPLRVEPLPKSRPLMLVNSPLRTAAPLLPPMNTLSGRYPYAFRCPARTPGEMVALLQVVAAERYPSTRMVLGPSTVYAPSTDAVCAHSWLATGTVHT